jgi:hypothetical protein
MKPIRILSLVASLGLAGTMVISATAAGASTKAQKKAQAKAHAAAVLAIKEKVLPLTDMPAGFVRIAPPSTKSTAACLRDTKTSSPGVIRAEVTYEDTPLPAYDQILESSANATSIYQRFNHSLATCRHFAFSFGGKTLKAKVTTMPFTSFGQQSSAYTITFTYKKKAIVLDQVFLQVGNEVTAISFEDFGPPPISQLEAFVGTAAAVMAYNPPVTTTTTAPKSTTTTTKPKTPTS